MNGWHVQATPFAPGRARGILRYTMAQAPDAVLVLSQDQLEPFAFRSLLTHRPAGLLVIDSAPFSHPMIRLLGLGIPIALINAEQAGALPEGAEVGLDGGSGLICASDTHEAQTNKTSPQVPRPGTPLLSLDGVAVELRASVADVQGAADALNRGAAALGLVRSEFLVPPDGRAPDAAFYQQALRALCEAAHPLAVTVRLLDLAADKRPPWLDRIAGTGGALGLQGARLYGVEPVRSAFHAEVQAIARLAPDFDLALLVPYVVRPEEFRHWRREIEERLASPMAVGSMAETPAAALGIGDLLREAEFVAIGCNDLMQCLFAADRDIPQLGGLLDPYAPVLFRFLRQVADEAGRSIGRVQVCGLLSQVPGILPVLIGLGYRVFSVEPHLIPYLAQTVTRTDSVAAEALAVGVCAARDADSVHHLLGLPRGSTRAYGSMDSGAPMQV